MGKHIKFMQRSIISNYNILKNRIYEETEAETVRINDGLEAKTRKSQANFQII